MRGVVLAVLAASGQAVVEGGRGIAESGEFVRRNGSRLELGGVPFRFAGMNMYWLGLDENCPPSFDPKLEGRNCIDYPTEWRVTDALETAVAMGANVVRAHTLGVSSGNPKSLMPGAPGQYNPGAYAAIDYAVSEAGRLGLKLIVPLTDNYNYYHGGYHDFIDNTPGTGVKCDPFPRRIPGATDPCRLFFDRNVSAAAGRVIDGFLGYVSELLNHTNTRTGVKLRDEPAILAWETGNELQIKEEPFVSWTEALARHIKEVAGAQQLVMDGRNEISAGRDSLALSQQKHVDMYTDHFYESVKTAVPKIGRDMPPTVMAQRVYTVGEWGPNMYGIDDVKTFTKALEAQGDGIGGSAWWSLFPHGDEYGFVPHGDSFTIHWPGDDDAMREKVAVLRAHAFRMRGLPVPADTPAPGTPAITRVALNASTGRDDVWWRGATLADMYDVERSDAGSAGPWVKVCDRCATDNDTPWAAPPKPASGAPSWYRVIAYSIGGVAGNASRACSAGEPGGKPNCEPPSPRRVA